MHEVLVDRLGGLSLPKKRVVRLTDRPEMTLDVYHGRKTTMQQQQIHSGFHPHELIFPDLLSVKMYYSAIIHGQEKFIFRKK